MLLNTVQDALVTNAFSSPLEGNYLLHDIPTCWYQDFLQPSKRQINCYGRKFDFSDHMVLFFGHTLPVMLFELLFCILVTYWRSHSSSFSLRLFPSNAARTLLIAAVVYFNFITLLAVHKTAAYFHTGSEVVVGYLISLVVQLPLGYVICFDRCEKLRHFVGLPTCQEKGQSQ